MQLSSSAFSNGSVIPRRFTCDGEELSPPLDWEAAPPTTCSFVLLCDDPDAPAGKWTTTVNTVVLALKALIKHSMTRNAQSCGTWPQSCC